VPGYGFLSPEAAAQDDGGNLMKTVDIEHTSLDACILDAQSEQVVITREGNPVALIVGVRGPDEEQIQLGSSDAFWQLISSRRKEDAVSRAALEEKIERNPAGRDAE
jgi:antitoxin (DNA-binding transcriptional repressor) of toxin-antitoxin stability system